MKIEILDKLDNGTHKWFLGKTSLWDYLCAVTKESFEFDIQRGVVKNKYLAICARVKMAFENIFSRL
jgi:hypothetical protein